MPLRPSRIGRAAVVGAAVAKPGPAPVAKAAVVGAAVARPGPAPVAKAAVVGAALTPGRRRFQPDSVAAADLASVAVTTIEGLVMSGPRPP